MKKNGFFFWYLAGFRPDLRCVWPTCSSKPAQNGQSTAKNAEIQNPFGRPLPTGVFAVGRPLFWTPFSARFVLAMSTCSTRALPTVPPVNIAFYSVKQTMLRPGSLGCSPGCMRWAPHTTACVGSLARLAFPFVARAMQLAGRARPRVSALSSLQRHAVLG
jgi:hypothetical protein